MSKTEDKLHFGKIELVRDQVMVELAWIGEGLDGDYNAEDSNDAPMLRFTVLKRSPKTLEWEAMEDASYCTQLKATDPRPKLKEAALFIMDMVEDSIKARDPIKKLCEWLSWITADGMPKGTPKKTEEKSNAKTKS